MNTTTTTNTDALIDALLTETTDELILTDVSTYVPTTDTTDDSEELEYCDMLALTL